MREILFICTGNTCRSPMAEGFFSHLAWGKALEWQSGSAGLGASGTPTPSRNEWAMSAEELLCRSCRTDSATGSQQ